MARLRAVVASQSVLLAKIVASILQEEGHQVEVCKDHFAAVTMFSRLRPDLMLLDLALPPRGGVAVMEELGRSRLKGVAFVLLGEPEEFRDKAQAKRYGHRLVHRKQDRHELSRRLRNLCDGLRDQHELLGRETLKHGPLKLDRAQQSLHANGERVAMEPVELAVLGVLMANPGVDLGARDLCDRIWDPDVVCQEFEVEDVIASIKRKIRLWAPDEDYIESAGGQFRLRGG